ncbi:hypothetical protein GQ43DRAFT_378051, partial [Delitschia confertaspora ATCC 74209]
KHTKTYNSQDSHVVTHRNTNWPVRSLSTADRTGSPIFSYLWSYVLILVRYDLDLLIKYSGLWGCVIFVKMNLCLAPPYSGNAPFSFLMFEAFSLQEVSYTQIAASLFYVHF